MNIKDALIDIFQSHASGAFLFIGSGFSRRYLGLEDWEGLLRKFCTDDIPFEYYLSKSDGNVPAAASLLAKDFNEIWWKSPDYSESRKEYQDQIKDQTSALRIEISNYLSSLDQSVAKKSDYSSEIDLLSGLNVDGIITTNWDLFLEELFPDYRTYVGQEELLFSNPQEIGEIYKIHGCISNFDSLVLTDADYRNFQEKNSYLAAKLITLFIEHPVVFIGYSMSDPNIKSLLFSIASCIGEGNLEKLRKNLIFVRRAKEGGKESIAETAYAIEGIDLPITLVELNDYSTVYEALDTTKRKIPAKILRLCKEQLYEIVQSQEPEKKVAVIDIDSIDSKDDIEFVVGLGVAQSQNEDLTQLGYSSLESQDLLNDLLDDDKGYEAEHVLESVVPKLTQRTENIITFKYLNRVGITSEEQYRSSSFNGTIDKPVLRTLESYQVKSRKQYFERDFADTSAEYIIENCTPENAAIYLTFLPVKDIDLDLVFSFILKYRDKLLSKNSPYASNFRKLACLYDRLKYGWDT